MTRRRSLPEAEELFRAGGPSAALGQRALVPVADQPQPGEPTRLSDVRARTPVSRRGRNAGDRRPTGRQRHDEKITVYVSGEELLDLEHARLTLRGDHGLAVDRGRIVREALAVVLADLDAQGAQSVLVRRLQAR